MNANQTSAPSSVVSRTRRLLRDAVQSGVVFAVRTSYSVIPKAFVWSRDHLLSITVLLMFPVAIAAYYWSNATIEHSQPPAYLLLEEQDEFASLPPSAADGESSLVSVAPETSMTLDAPPTLSSPSSLPGAELSVPQSLPIDDNSLGQLSQSGEPTPLPEHIPVIPRPSRMNSSADCVWLTGNIEEVESLENPLFNASRVHDLTGFSRK